MLTRRSPLPPSLPANRTHAFPLAPIMAGLSLFIAAGCGLEASDAPADSDLGFLVPTSNNDWSVERLSAFCEIPGEDQTLTLDGVALSTARPGESASQTRTRVIWTFLGNLDGGFVVIRGSAAGTQPVQNGLVLTDFTSSARRTTLPKSVRAREHFIEVKGATEKMTTVLLDRPLRPQEAAWLGGDPSPGAFRYVKTKGVEGREPYWIPIRRGTAVLELSQEFQVYVFQEASHQPTPLELEPGRAWAVVERTGRAYNLQTQSPQAIRLVQEELRTTVEITRAIDASAIDSNEHYGQQRTTLSRDGTVGAEGGVTVSANGTELFAFPYGTCSFSSEYDAERTEYWNKT